MRIGNLKNYLNTVTNKKYFPVIYYSILGIPILVAGLIKFVNPSDFASVLKYSFYLPEWSSTLLATVLPLLEILLGISLVMNIYQSKSLVVYRILLLSFLIFHIWNYFFAGKKPCDCFGNLMEFGGTQMIVIVIVLLVASFLKVQFNSTQETINKYISSKNRLILNLIVFGILSVSILTRWARIDREITSGLISHVELPWVKDKITSSFRSFININENNKFTLVVILRGKLCRSCLEEINFWNDVDLSNKVNLLMVFHSFEQDEIKNYKKRFGIKLTILPISDEIYYETLGMHPQLINRLLFDGNGNLIQATSTQSDYSEKEHFLSSLNNIIINNKRGWL